MKNFSIYQYRFVMGLLAITVLISCNRTFDVPPENADPEVDVTMTIAELKSRYEAIGDFKRLDEEAVISGVVIADDRSGNFYKQIIIQDETGGIPVLLDGNNVYTKYPIGRRVFVKLKGMMLGDYGGTIQLGLDSSRSDDGRFLNLDGIPQAMYDQYIVKGSFNNIITPKVISPEAFTKNINDPLLSTLVEIDDAEFRYADIDKTYADPSKNVSAVNFTIHTCGNKNIILRNSSYAKFASLNVPEGNGPLIGVPSVFNGTVQMYIRDTADVQFSRTRCSGQVPSPTLKSIEEVKAYAVGDSLIPAGVFITGIVISDTKNEAAGNYRLQDESGGIQLRFDKDANPNAAFGDSLTVTVGGQRLSVYNGGLQIEKINKVSKSGKGNIEPKIATIADIIGHNRLWESTVVEIKNVTILQASSNSTGINYTLTDASGSSIKTFVRNTAGITMPTNATSITGYVSVYQSVASGSPIETQLTLRNQQDIIGGSGGGFSVAYDFSATTNATGTVDPTDVPTVDGLSFGSFNAIGVSANSNAAGRFSFTSWSTGSIDLEKYYEFSIEPRAGKKIDIANIFFTVRRSATGVKQFSLRCSIDEFTSNLPALIMPVNDNLSVISTNIFEIKEDVTTAQDGCVVRPGDFLKNIDKKILIRFYGFNAQGTSGTFSIDNVKVEGMVK